MSRDILEYFPLPSPRPQQVQALRYVQDVVAQGFRDIALECPTGIGKSAIAATIAAWSYDNLQLESKQAKGAHILVQQKVLQDQIERELERLGGKEKAALIKASIEYPCPQFKKCSVGLLDRRCSCVAAGACSYRLAKGKFLTAKVAITNYAYYFTERQHVGQIEPRQILVCDEAHQVARTLLRQVDVVINEEKLEQFAPGVHAQDLYRIETLDEFLDWIEDDYLPAVQEQAELLQALNDNDDQMREAYETSQHLLKVGSFLARAQAQPKGWVFWPEENRERRRVLTARPLDAAPYFTELIGKEVPARVYLSAFLGPKAIFCSDLGLDPKRVAWMRQSSPFPVDNRPIHLLDVGPMSRQFQDESLPRVLRMMVRIAQAHPDTRGIIHPNSYKLAEAAVQALHGAGLSSRVVYPKNADERDAALTRHAKLPGGILISPSVGEGFDFRGDLARWQIILKTPYPSLGDKHTEIKAERDPSWYQAETIKHFVQVCGRICRALDDRGETFCLDSDILKVLRSTGSTLPKWFRSALFTAQGEPFFGD